MKISGPGPGGGERRAGKTSKDKSAEFARALRRFSTESKGEGVSGACGADPATNVAGLDALLAAQMVDGVGAVDEDGRRQQAMIQRGEDILDRLEELRIGLLLGHVPKDRLASLARLVREQREDAQDPQLAALLDEIELRAEVELAKLERG